MFNFLPELADFLLVLRIHEENENNLLIQLFQTFKCLLDLIAQFVINKVGAREKCFHHFMENYFAMIVFGEKAFWFVTCLTVTTTPKS